MTIKEIIENHEGDRARYSRLNNYYIGKTEITKRVAKNDKPNNKLVSGFPSTVIDTITGYLMGRPIAYGDSEAPDLLEKITEIFEYNDEQEINTEHVKQASIKGRSYEVLYTDEEANLRIAQVNAENVILLYNNKIIPEIVQAIVFYHDEDVIVATSYEYDDGRVMERMYEIEDNEERLIEERVSLFDQIPIVEISPNSERMGLFEKAIPLIDAYEKAISDTANDLEYFTDAYLWLPGFGGFDPENEEDLKKFTNMREQRVFLPSDDGAKNIPSFVTKSINDTVSENHKERLSMEIHKLVNVPDLSDEYFGGQQSGVSLAYKLWGIENVCSAFERRFKKAIQKRIELICEHLNLRRGGQYSWRNITIMFTRNTPDNLVEAVQAVEKLRGTVSNETLLGQLPFIDNPTAERKRLANENAGTVDLYAEAGDEE